MREGEWLIGMGMAAAVRINLLVDSQARVTLGTDGRATIETDMTDIGTGTYTILAQIGGESLGLPIRCVDVKLGDTDLPPGAGSGGSFGAASAGFLGGWPARTSSPSWRDAWTPFPRT